MNPRVDNARSAGRSLSASNAVSFDCVHSFEESRAKLAAITIRPRLPERRTQVDAYDMKMAPVSTVLQGNVTGEGADLSWGFARFRGRWNRTELAVRLEGHVGISLYARLALAFFAVPVVAATLVALKAADATSWQAPGVYAFLFPVTLVFVGMPLVVMGLGSARVAHEIELVRTIGLAIGDPEKYAVKWRRVRDD